MLLAMVPLQRLFSHSSIYREGLKNVAAGHNPMALKRGIEKAVNVVVNEIHNLSKEVSEKTEIAQVARYLRK